MIASMVAGLLVAATTLAVSPHSDRVIAATDGTRVWVTENAGQNWRQIASESANNSDDNSGDPPRAGVRSLAFLGAELLWSTPAGLKAWTPGKPMPEVRSGRAFFALCGWEKTLFATQSGNIYRSDDGGKSFVALLRAPGAPVRSLAVTDKRMLLSTVSGTFFHDGVSWRRISGPAYVAASSDGSLWRAGSLGIERSAHAQRWRLTHHGRFLAVAIGPGQVWAATAGRVFPVASQPSSANRGGHRARLGNMMRHAFALSRKARRAAWLPAVHITAHAHAKTTQGHSLGRQQEIVLLFSLAWALDRAVENRTTVSALQTALNIHRLIQQKTGAKQ